MTMGKHGDIHLLQIHAERLDIVLEAMASIAGIKKDGFAVVPDKRRETPVENRASLLVAEGVVEIQNRVLTGGGERAGRILRQQQERVADEQQGDRARDTFHGDLRKIADDSIREIRQERSETLTIQGGGVRQKFMR